MTTELFKNIADAYQVESFDTLTGFKNIAEVIRELEGKKTFIGGGEESYGYMISDYVRDKDAIASVAMIAEMTAYVKSQGKTLYDYLIEMYMKFGFYREDLVSITKKGKSGSEEIKAMMTRFREEPPKKLAGTKILEVRDYQKSTILDMESG